MKVYLCRTYSENRRNYNNVEVWGSYSGTNDFWDYSDNSIAFIPLTVFKAKQVQKEHKNENTYFWVEPVN